MIQRKRRRFVRAILGRIILGSDGAEIEQSVARGVRRGGEATRRVRNMTDRAGRGKARNTRALLAGLSSRLPFSSKQRFRNILRVVN